MLHRKPCLQVVTVDDFLGQVDGKVEVGVGGLVSDPTVLSCQVEELSGVVNFIVEDGSHGRS